MKQLILSTLVSLILITGVVAQTTSTSRNARCSSAVSSYLFKQKSREIQEANTESVRLSRARALVKNYCLTAEQIKEVASFFLNDYDRLVFAKAAYLKTFDPDNFYDVYDAFAYFSTVFRLHDYVTQQRQGNSMGGGNTGGNTGGVTVTFPNYNYPNPDTYTGAKNCAHPLNNDTFIFRYNKIAKKQNDQSRLLAAVQFVNNQCLSTAQVMKLSTLFNLESNKLNFLKQSYGAVYDPNNLSLAEQIFTQLSTRQDFRSFLQNQNTGGGIGGGGTNFACQIDVTEFNRIKQNIQSQTFNNTRQNTAKQIMRSKGKCFTAEQVKEIVALFDFESSRLEIAKYAYDYTLDQDNYYVVNNAFKFSSSKDQLLEYIRNR
ncbi:MAG: DUF4476 domain-containing protein [Flammeovirgaceae bacterium]